jgi:hypothetical protein
MKNKQPVTPYELSHIAALINTTRPNMTPEEAVHSAWELLNAAETFLEAQQKDMDRHGVFSPRPQRATREAVTD